MEDCIFCQVIKGEADSWKVYETKHAYAFLDINPVNEYHTLVIPKRHCTNILDCPQEDFVSLMSALKDVVDLYRDRLGLKNLQILNSNGQEGQQDVFHLHFHIVPRHSGDGQNITWTPHPEMRDRFDELLARLN